MTASRGRGWGRKLALEEEVKRNQVLSSSCADAQRGSHRQLPEALPAGLPCLASAAFQTGPVPQCCGQTLRSDPEESPEWLSGLKRPLPRIRSTGPCHFLKGRGRAQALPVGGSPSVGTASGSRSSSPHFRGEEAEAWAGEASRQGACCSRPWLMGQDSHTRPRVCSDSLVPIQLWALRKRDLAVSPPGRARRSRVTGGVCWGSCGPGSLCPLAVWGVCCLPQEGVPTW